MQVPSEEIAGAGDVYFLVGGRIRFKALSNIVAIASPVLKVMLSGKFSEGRQLSTTNPETIELPDDDADGFRLLLKVMHHAHKPAATQPDLAVFVSAVELADKYHCKQCLYFGAHTWLSSIKDIRRDNVRVLVCIAHDMGMEEEFRSLTSSMVIKCAGAFHDLPDEDSPMFSISVLYALHAQRQRARNHLFTEFEKIITEPSLCGTDQQVGNRRPHFTEHCSFKMRVLDESDAVPFYRSLQNNSVLGAKDIVLTLASRLKHAQERRATCPRHSQETPAHQVLTEAADRALNICRGLCLTCLRDNPTASESCTGHDV